MVRPRCHSILLPFFRLQALVVANLTADIVEAILIQKKDSLIRLLENLLISHSLSTATAQQQARNGIGPAELCPAKDGLP